jgi:hypothetical protein
MKPPPLAEDPERFGQSGIDSSVLGESFSRSSHLPPSKAGAIVRVVMSRPLQGAVVRLPAPRGRIILGRYALRWIGEFDEGKGGRILPVTVYFFCHLGVFATGFFWAYVSGVKYGKLRERCASDKRGISLGLG